MKIFLSAVSGQFKDCRDALRSDLSAASAEVVVQEDFRQHGASLLEKLERYIASCDRIIALVGDAYGFEPEEMARPAGRPRRSYSQWEYFFAMGERLDGSRQRPKAIFLYIGSPEFLARHPVSQADDVAQLQQEFINELIRSGKDRSQFGSRHELRALVLRDVKMPAWQRSRSAQRTTACNVRFAYRFSDVSEIANIDESVLAKICQIGHRELDEFKLDKTIKILSDIYPAGIHCWCTIKEPGAVIAFFIFAPITRITCNQILADRIRGATDLGRTAFVKKARNAYGIYIMSIVSTNKRYHGYLMRHLKKEIASLLKRNPGIKYIFTRPINAHVASLATRYGFKPTSEGPSPIYVTTRSKIGLKDNLLYPYGRRSETLPSFSARRSSGGRTSAGLN